MQLLTDRHRDEVHILPSIVFEKFHRTNVITFSFLIWSIEIEWNRKNTRYFRS